MSALTSIFNPNASDDQSIHLFFNTAGGQLGLQLRAGDKSKGDKTTFAAAEDAPKGNIINPSEMGTATYRGVNWVVGVTKPKADANEQQTVNCISIISPIPQQLNTTTLVCSKTAMTGAGDSAWVYYFNGTDEQNTTLKEYDMESGSTSTYLESQRILKDSSIASYYDPGVDGADPKRYAIYQDYVTKYLVEFDIIEKQDTSINNVTDAKQPTSMAVTLTEGKVYLYYFDTNDNLRRVIKSKGKWGSPESVPNSPKCKANAQLSVTTANGLNHVFYTSKEDKPGGFTQMKDKVQK